MSRCPSARCVLACAARAVMAALLALPAAACSDDGVGPDGQAQDQLIFLSNRDGGITPSGEPRHDIYRMRADGTGLRNLTRHAATYRFLSLSPDGRRLVFESDRSGNDIWVMNVDGTGLARLTNQDGGEGEGINRQPQWSPDGTRIAFLSNRESLTSWGSYDVYVMDADGSNPRNVSHSLGDELGFDVRVSGWSPGGQVVFQSTDIIGAAYHDRVYLVNADGSGLRALFPGNVDHSPAWSPDGSRVAFISRRDGEERLYVMNADGSDARPLTSHVGWDRLPGWSNDGREMAYTPWSPDGTRIAFQRLGTISTWGTLHVIGVDGEGLQQLTAEIATFNGWAPRGDRIAFTSRRGGSSDVYSILFPEGDQVNLTSQLSADLYDERNALWLPRR